MNLPIDLAFTVATTATADLFANRATTNVSSLAGGNDALKAITDGGLTLADANIVIPPTTAAGLFIDGYNLETNTACVVQIGIINAAGSTFVPLDTHVCTGVAAGGISRSPGGQAGIAVPLVPASLGTTWRLVIRVSGYGSATAVRITGHLDIYYNGGR